MSPLPQFLLLLLLQLGGPLGGCAGAGTELLARGAAVDAAINDDWTSLYFASLVGHLEVVRELLARGANPRLVTNSGDTALSVATRHGHAAIGQLLTAALAAP
jgi:ankyrin repeat protein